MTTGLSQAFGNYAKLSTATTAQNKIDIISMLNSFGALFNQEGPSNNTTGQGNVPVYPDFAIIPQQAASQILAEVAAMVANITASP